MKVAILAGGDSSLTRRELLRAGAASALLALVPGRVFAANAEAEASFGATARAAVQTSPLIYICPLKRDGSESRCHGEVWFVEDSAPGSSDLLVVTEPGRWRAAAIVRGLGSARIWAGDHGVWSRSGSRFREAPRFLASASIEGDPGTHARALSAFGKKYANSWEKWGPRFERGLASGERVMIRYRPE